VIGVRDYFGGWSFGGGVANGGLDGFLQSFFVAAGDVHLGSVALEGLGDDETQARATFVENSSVQIGSYYHKDPI
jgi:hypothetical protein